MSLQLEVGKTYKDREGRLITITGKRDFNCTYPYTGDSGKTYMPNGRFYDFDFHDNDLVKEALTMQMVSSTWGFPNFKQVEEETKMSLELEVGVTYISREGSLVTIVERVIDAKVFPFRGDNKIAYTKEGSEFINLESKNDLIQIKSTEVTKMQDQIITINCTLVVRDIEGTLTLQVHPKDEFWRADAATTILDSSFELVLPRAKVEELYTERLLAKVQKADKDYKEALEAFDAAKTFLDNL
jgi:hypothetical protein